MARSSPCTMPMAPSLSPCRRRPQAGSIWIEEFLTRRELSLDSRDALEITRLALATRRSALTRTSGARGGHTFMVDQVGAADVP